MRAGAAKLLCRRRFLLHRGVGEGESPTLCLYLPRNPTIAQFFGIYKEIFRAGLGRRLFLDPAVETWYIFLRDTVQHRRGGSATPPERG